MSRPERLQERVFTKLFEAAEIARFDSNELRSYEQSINAYRDIKNSIDTASKDGFTKGKAEGLAEGKAKGIRTTAHNLKQMGLDVYQISKATGLSIEEIKQL